ncbi:hypothetical protein V9L05_09875 [Bernardetia sp. Wsw4-3y2]|uniref:hypothetical protein n=1 Tax=Bernardetia sp. Wsw4-3y2 TaxID=3127471 RepID=UPI0030D54C92
MEENERNCIEFPLDLFFNEDDWQIISPQWEIKLYLDEENMMKIVDFLTTEEAARKKLNNIFNIIFSGTYRDKLYRKEIIDDATKDITAMKFIFKSNKGGKLNARIYCKEFFEDDRPKFKKIVMLFFLRHKDEQKIPTKTKRKITQMNEFIYLFNNNDEDNQE